MTTSYQSATAAPTKTTKPIVYIPNLVYAKLMAYARQCSIEISGMGFVETLPDNRGFRITDIFCPPQACSAGGTEFDALAFNQIIAGWAMNDEDQKTETLRCWWH